ncbi:methyl-accepting chemotaxis protein [Metabacillus malikii]|uniref:Methyl-accepting chemotaxis protein n=1 Tax=Metabacillus malikii TaxID=1504265 RepID=A0ABT9ZIC3_9BACI|nr:HAMP domain-containing methyl-accepting chemotaxis protein [Metabacillus malikii]MDQ0232033.1 methyl-accepting chemotaxis protein [Metabacillus malikii]
MKAFNFRNLKIGWKYGIILAILFILFGASTAFVLKLVSDVGGNIDELERRSERAVNVTEMGSVTRAKYIRILQYNQKPGLDFLNQFEEQRAIYDELEAELIGKMDTDAQKSLYEKIIDNDKEMSEIFTKDLVAAKNNVDELKVANIISQLNDIQLETVAYLDELRATVNEERDLAVSEAKESQVLVGVVLFISMVLSIIIGAILTLLVSRNVSKGLNKVVKVANQVADGNLAVEKISYNGKDEIGQLVGAVNTMSGNLRTIIQQVSGISGTLTSHSEELTQSSNEVKEGTQQVASTMQELASGSESQASQATKLSSTMDAFSVKMDEANSFGEMIAQSSTGVVDMTNEGGELMETSVKQMGAIDQIVQDAVQKVRGLDQKSQEISNLVQVIKDIAEQTNLLALNAAIEAARAGEHGRGFAVVADEVRKLAEQVTASIGDITNIVTSIQAESTDVAESLQGGYKEVEKGTNQIKSTGTMFSEIKQAINEMVQHVNKITGNLSEMSADSRDMVTSIQEIASVSEEAAAGVEQTAASTQQTSSSMDEVARSSEELAKLAESLNEVVRTFKL